MGTMECSFTRCRRECCALVDWAPVLEKKHASATLTRPGLDWCRHFSGFTARAGNGIGTWNFVLRNMKCPLQWSSSCNFLSICPLRRPTPAETAAILLSSSPRRNSGEWHVPWSATVWPPGSPGPDVVPGLHVMPLPAALSPPPWCPYRLLRTRSRAPCRATVYTGPDRTDWRIPWHWPPQLCCAGQDN